MSRYMPRGAQPERLSGAVAHPTMLETKRMAALALRLGGLHLNPEKTDFFNQRLTKRLLKTGKKDFRAYCDYLESNAGSSEYTSFIEALTTHTTSFFREQKHFDWLAGSGWADLVASGAGIDRPLRIWSAACSNGAELYSTLMSLREFSDSDKRPLRVEGVGTDLSSAILKTAAKAVYTRREIEGLSETRRKRFLLKARDGSDKYRIEPALRALTSWSLLNLTDMQQKGPSSADVILLRNVLIYFDPATQARVVSGLCARLRKHGLLMTGHSETLSKRPDGMVPVTVSVYRKEGP